MHRFEIEAAGTDASGTPRAATDDSSPEAPDIPQRVDHDGRDTAEKLLSAARVHLAEGGAAAHDIMSRSMAALAGGVDRPRVMDVEVPTVSRPQPLLESPSGISALAGPVPSRVRRRSLLRHSRRRTYALVGASTAMVAFSGVVTLPAAGADRPSKVLQAVDVQVGTDGSVTALTSLEVRKTDGRTSSEKSRLDPAKVAGALPVRVLTSYVHEGKTGTDLAELRGTHGRVQVTVTVQNTTVHAERLSYDVAGRREDRFALIGTPMTVTASALLAKGSFAKVVLPTRDATGAVTDGVVGHTASGDTTVQWAALLAPPRLSSTASFTLVEDASNFRMPHFDLMVQPGLVTDPSVDRLVREAFRKDGGSQLNLESNTIVLIGTVNGVLGEATQTLAQIRETLADGSSTIGSRLLSQLATSSSDLTSAAGDLSARLDGLNVGLSAALQRSHDNSIASLQRTVARLSNYLGHPDDAPIVPLPVTPGCAIKPVAAGTSTTLYGQLKNVSRQLLTLRSATQGCTDVIKASLGATLGDPANCPAGTTTAACTLVTARGQLSDVASYLAQAGSALVAQLNPTAVDKVRAELATVTTAVTEMQKASDKLGNGTGGTTADTLKTQLDALSASLGTLIDGVQPGGTGLAASLAELNALAKQHRDAIGGTQGSASSISGQVATAAHAVCATPSALDSPDPDSVAYLDRLRALLVGTDCGTAHPSPLPHPSGYPTPIADRLELEYQAWADVARLTDLSAPSPLGAAKEAHDLATALQGVRDDINALSASVGGAGGGSLKNKIVALQGQIAGLYTATTTPTACPVVDSGTTLPALNALATAFAVLDCNQDGLAANLSALLVSATPTFDHAAAVADAAANAANKARLDASAALDQLLGTLDTSLDRAADSTVADGRVVVDAQQAALADQERTFTTDLDAATRGAIDDISRNITSSNQLLTQSTDLLKRGLEAVQLDLGTGGDRPRGLLGVVSSSASRTGESADRVGDINDQAAAFGGARGSELDDVLLQQEQLTRALELQAAYPPFALKLPPGSTSLVVFTFHVKGV
jgi:hypothetical protein